MRGFGENVSELLCTCGYDLTGLPEVYTCPECGTEYNKIELEAQRRRSRHRFYLRIGVLVAGALWIGLAVVPYHVQGMAWYDYGLSSHRPLSPYHYSSVPEGYKADLFWPFTVPVIGSLCFFITDTLIWVYLASFLAVPVTIYTIAVAWKASFLSSGERKTFRVVLLMTLLPYAYLALWGQTIFSWSID